MLLRYVNAGSRAHPMSLLGADQLLLARRRPRARLRPSRRSSPPVEPGATVDTLVTMPTGPEAKVALFEAGGAPRQRRPDHEPTPSGRHRRHDDLPRHERAAARRPTSSARSSTARRGQPRTPRTASSAVTVTADLSDAPHRRVDGRPGRARRRRRRHRRRRLRHPDDRHASARATAPVDRHHPGRRRADRCTCADAPSGRPAAA